MRRSDFYIERARELCLAARIDPDSRVGEGRGKPAWCLYRDAARKKHLARVANSAASEIASLRPQDAFFRNAPMKFFGPHEEATVAQMRNCSPRANLQFIRHRDQSMQISASQERWRQSGRYRCLTGFPAAIPVFNSRAPEVFGRARWSAVAVIQGSIQCWRTKQSLLAQPPEVIERPSVC
ncbi:hypothetical protein [Bradyrhizobium liaoningense]|uniref:hypothetical protein n=1 Tax=Bradyrhizobium liaoningense TaxID=43992 RepID=UPI0020134D9F|nr:hypothetical protein [Bradyrhizobium liaoningense]